MRSSSAATSSPSERTILASTAMSSASCSRNGVHTLLANEAYAGTLLWGLNARDRAPPMRVDDAFPVPNGLPSITPLIAGSNGPPSADPFGDDLDYDGRQPWPECLREF